MSARTIDDVMRDLDEIIEYSRRENWRIGYFAALYHHVGVAFKQSTEHGVFQDTKCIEKLDVVFFDRFLAAVYTHRHGGSPSKSWKVAFDAAERWRPTVLSHLLIGMNAHINFDLGIAVAATVPAAELEGFRSDFDKMNALLGSLVGVVEQDLARIWPWFGWLHRFAGGVEDGIINFSMRGARELAWQSAESLAGMSPTERQAKIEEMDETVSELGHMIWKPGFGIGLIFDIMRLEQRGTVPDLIDILLSNRTKTRMHQTVNESVLKWKAEANA
jgi:hypothetical protein